MSNTNSNSHPKPGSKLLRKPKLPIHHIVLSGLILLILPIIMSFFVSCGEVAKQLGSSGFTGSNGPNATFIPAPTLTTPSGSINIEGSCKVPPVVGTGNGSGYNGLGYDDRTFVSIDPEVTCHSDILGETNITSMLTKSPDGSYIRTEGCNKENPIPVDPTDSVKLIGSEDDPAAPKYIRLPDLNVNYEQLSQNSCQSQVGLKDKIGAVCKYTNQYGYGDFIINNTVTYYINELVVVIKAPNSIDDAVTGEGIYEVEVSYIIVEKNSNAAANIVHIQKRLPSLKLTYTAGKFSYQKENNLEADSSLLGSTLRPFALDFNVLFGGITSQDLSSQLTLNFKDNPTQSMNSHKCEWK